MKNPFLILCFYFFSLGTFAQSINVDYKIVVNKENLDLDKLNKDVPSNVVNTFKEAYGLINKMKMHLEANKKEALFWGNNKMVNDVDPMVYNMAKIMLGDDEEYLTNLATGLVFKQVEAFGNVFLIKDSIRNVNWKLTKEQKKIGNYICFKATTHYLISNSVGNFKKEVIAWYCPSIAFNFGPKNFSGLPGLILELTDDKIIYIFDKIKFIDENIKIKEFKKGKFVSNEELENMASKAIEERKNSIKKE